MKHKTFWLSFVAVVAITWMGVAPAAFADSIGPNCGGGECLGSIYTLTSNFLIDAESGKYDITLTINTTGFTNPAAFIDAVSIEINGATAVDLDSAPGGTGLWFSQTGGQDSGGCNGKGAFVCAGLNATGLASPPTPTPDGTYTWVYDVTIPGTISPPEASHVKALYLNADGSVNGMTSADLNIQLIPEPATLLLFGTGLLGVGAKLRRRRKA